MDRMTLYELKELVNTIEKSKVVENPKITFWIHGTHLYRSRNIVRFDLDMEAAAKSPAMFTNTFGDVSLKLRLE